MRVLEKRLSTSEKKSTTKHIERIRNSYRKKRDCYAVISASVGNKSIEKRRNSQSVLSGEPVIDRKISSASRDGSSKKSYNRKNLKLDIEEKSESQPTEDVLRHAAEK